jgi:peptidoglycan/xylan/chitin deacetylase (PgdA/CDA1 family)
VPGPRIGALLAPRVAMRTAVVLASLAATACVQSACASEDEHGDETELFEQAYEDARDEGKVDSASCSGVTVPDRNGFNKRIALTFDDGPNPDTTPQVIATLKKHRAPATFFTNGSRYAAAGAKDLAKQHRRRPGLPAREPLAPPHQPRRAERGDGGDRDRSHRRADPRSGRVAEVLPVPVRELELRLEEAGAGSRLHRQRLAHRQRRLVLRGRRRRLQEVDVQVRPRRHAQRHEALRALAGEGVQRRHRPVPRHSPVDRERARRHPDGARGRRLHVRSPGRHSWRSRSCTASSPRRRSSSATSAPPTPTARSPRRASRGAATPRASAPSRAPARVPTSRVAPRRSASPTSASPTPACACRRPRRRTTGARCSPTPRTAPSRASSAPAPPRRRPRTSARLART